jgi:plastocyanin
MGDDSNDSGTGTTITDQGSGGNNGTLTNGPTFSMDTPAALTTTFSPTIAGTYQYYCTSHSSMIGNINVLKREGYENIFGIQNS